MQSSPCPNGLCPSKGIVRLPSLLETARLAFDLTNCDWDTLNSPTTSSDRVNVHYSQDASVLIERMNALFLIRVVALVCARSRTTKFSFWQALPWFEDLSTSTICYTLLTEKKDTGGDWEWPVTVTKLFMTQLKGYVSKIISLYQDVPYHNFEHAYHVFISANKILDLLLCECYLPPLSGEYAPLKLSKNSNEANGIKPTDSGESAHRKTGKHSNETNGVKPTENGQTKTLKSTHTNTLSKVEQKKLAPFNDKPFRPTYGIKRDTLIQIAFLFSALVHDVEHSGVTNRQLVLEGDELAIMYNDQSVAEQRSLTVAFSLIREPQYDSLRGLLFDGKDGISEDAYMRFRSTVIDLVLCTDIASPERVQIVKSKFKEAFGDVHKRASTGWTNRTVNCKQTPNCATQQAKKIAKIGKPDRRFSKRTTLLGERAMLCNNLPTTKEVDSSSSSSSGNERDTSDDCNNNDLNMQNILMTNIAPKLKNKWCTNSVDISHKRRWSDDISQKRLTSKARKSFKLGIRRTLDLDGATIEPFRGSQTLGLGEIVGDIDEPNDLKLIVILELMLKAADISANLQCWENMIFFSTRLFREQRASHCAGRGDNPATGWFENQRVFIESYTLPLARRLAETGVFQKDFCQILVNCAEQNRARWIEEGSSVYTNMFRDGSNETYQGS